MCSVKSMMNVGRAYDSHRSCSIRLNCESCSSSLYEERRRMCRSQVVVVVLRCDRPV